MLPPNQRKPKVTKPFVRTLSTLSSLIDNFIKQHRAEQANLANHSKAPEFEMFWKAVKYPSTKSYTAEECCREFCGLKMAWKMAKEVLECEGFVWSEEDETVRGSDEVWTALAAADVHFARLKNVQLPLFEKMKECAAEKEDDTTRRAAREAALAQLRRETEEAAPRHAEAQGDEEVRLQAVRASEAELFKAELNRFNARQLAKAQKAASDATLTLGRKRRSWDTNDDISKRPRTNVQSLINLITSVQLTSDAEEAAIRDSCRILGKEITLTDLGKANFSEILGHVARNATPYSDLRREDIGCNDALRVLIIKGYFEEYVEGCGSLQYGEGAREIQANFVSVAAGGE